MDILFKIGKTKVTLGSILYAIHKVYLDKHKDADARIIVCRVKSFQRKSKKLLPVLTEVGKASHELDSRQYYLYTDIEAASLALLSTVKYETN